MSFSSRDGGDLLSEAWFIRRLLIHHHCQKLSTVAIVLQNHERWWCKNGNLDYSRDIVCFIGIYTTRKDDIQKLLSKIGVGSCIIFWGKLFGTFSILYSIQSLALIFQSCLQCGLVYTYSLSTKNYPWIAVVIDAAWVRGRGRISRHLGLGPR